MTRKTLGIYATSITLEAPILLNVKAYNGRDAQKRAFEKLCRTLDRLNFKIKSCLVDEVPADREASKRAQDRWKQNF
jgi:hypothetical protein